MPIVKNTPEPKGAWSAGQVIPTAPQVQGFKNRFKKFKTSQKILKISKNTSRFIEFNGVKNFQICAHLVFFCGHWKFNRKRKRKNSTGSTSNTRKKY
jgi:hypothetical protein